MRYSPLQIDCAAGYTTALHRFALCCVIASFGAVVPRVVVAQSSTNSDTRTERDEKDQKVRALAERLIRNTVNAVDEDVMDALIRLMDRSARNLELSFDAGIETQSVQIRIVERLDEAIKAAAAQRRPSRSRPQNADGDKRQSQPKQRGDREPGSSGRTGQGERSGSQLETESTTLGGQTGATRDLEKQRRTWGHLPMRERDEIIQGLSDTFLERYRIWIERYYRALQETKD